jgi:hypothetical protein
MAIMQQRKEQHREEGAIPVRTAVDAAVHAARSGWLSSVFSAVAVLASCVSVYVSTLQAAQLEVYLPPVFFYAMDGEGENFTIPVSLANGGARGGTVVSMELEVHNPRTKATHRFYSAYMGEHPQMQTTPNVRQFRPMTVLGQTVYSDTVRFYPVKSPPAEARNDPSYRLVQGEGGDYDFRLKINLAAPPDPSILDRLQGRTQPVPISFQMTLPRLDYRGLMQMRSKEWFASAG